MININSFHKACISGVVAIGIASLSGLASAAAPLPDWDGSLPTAGDLNTSQEYQDFTVYSLNYLTQLSEKNPDAGDTYYIDGQSYDYQTSPGNLHDDVVVITGNTGQVNNNLDTCGGTAASSGCDNSYSYPSPSDTYMSTETTFADPSVVVDGEETRSTWTATQESMETFLGDGDLTFLFNLNEDNGGLVNTLDGQALLMAAKVDLTDAAGNVLVSFYLGANNAIGLPTTAEDGWLADGSPEADPTNTVAGTEAAGSEADELYDPQLVDTGTDNGWISTDPRWAYIHGAISVDATTGVFLAMGDCTSTGYANCETVNQNLGADQAAFAALNLTLSDLIKDGCLAREADMTCTADNTIAFMNVDVIIAGQSNGFEQLVIIATNVDDFTNVPEPGTLAIFALGLLALGLSIRKRRIGIAA